MSKRTIGAHQVDPIAWSWEYLRISIKLIRTVSPRTTLVLVLNWNFELK